MFDYGKVDEVISTVANTFHPQKIIIFGSVASGTAHSDSDIDLLVIMETDKKEPYRSVPVAISVGHIFIDKDIIVITPQEYESRKNDEKSMIYQIDKTGKVAYEA